MAKYNEQGFVVELAPKEILVVGTNIHGVHGGGAAKYAYEHFGLARGYGEGLSGQTYALPTMEGMYSLQEAAERFIDFARSNPDLRFYLTRVACGIAGYKDEEIAPLFKDVPSNVIKPKEWEAA